MQNRNRGRYEIAGSEVVSEGADMRVSVLTLAAGQEVPWHYRQADPGLRRFVLHHRHAAS